MTKLHRVLVSLVAAGVAGCLWIGSAAAQESSAASPGVERAAETPAAAQKFRGRLPAYYGEVCDDEQRQAIYAIQGEYVQAIADLEAKLASLRAERDAKIEAVLKPEQLEKVSAAREAAKAKRRRTTSPSASAPATQPAPAAAVPRTSTTRPASSGTSSSAAK